MKHLFIINPAAKRVKNRVEKIHAEIDDYFKTHLNIPYDVYETKWCRDAVTYVRRYIMNEQKDSDRSICIHSIGGNGTLLEVVNGVVGFPNVQIAVYPYGRTNVFLKYFKPFGLTPFASIKRQMSGNAVPMDALRCRNNYGICFGIVGLEAYCDAKGDEFIEKGMPPDLSFVCAAVPYILKGASQTYTAIIDGQKINGDFISIFIANTPCYGQHLYPGVEAHPDDGKLEVYLHGVVTKSKTFSKTLPYLKGGHAKIPSIFHYSCKRITLTSNEAMCLNIDSETLYATSVEFELIPNAIQLVLPQGVNLSEIPLIYNNPEGGLRGGR